MPILLPEIYRGRFPSVAVFGSRSSYADFSAFYRLRSLNHQYMVLSLWEIIAPLLFVSQLDWKNPFTAVFSCLLPLGGSIRRIILRINCWTRCLQLRPVECFCSTYLIRRSSSIVSLWLCRMYNVHFRPDSKSVHYMSMHISQIFRLSVLTKICILRRPMQDCIQLD